MTFNRPASSSTGVDQRGGYLPAVPEALAMPFIMKAQDGRNEMQRILIEEEAEYAKILGMGANGDGKGSIISSLIENMKEEGTQEANQLNDQAMASYASMGTSLGSVGVMGADSLYTSRQMAGPEAEAADATAMQTDMQTVSPTEDVIKSRPANEEREMESMDVISEKEAVIRANKAKQNAAVEAQMQKFENGEIDHYSAGDKEINREALRQIKAKAVNELKAGQKTSEERLSEKIEKRIESKSSQISRLESARDRRSRYLQFAGDATKSGTDAKYKADQSAAAEAKANASAASAVLRTTMQQQQDTISSYDRQAKEAHDSAQMYTDMLAALARNNTKN